MANSNNPFGLKPVRYLSGAPYNGACNPYSTASGDGTALWIGDLVKFAGTSQLLGDGVYLDVAKAATTDVVLGAVVAVDPLTGSGASGRDSTIYRAASTIRVVWVADDPNLLFEAQEVTGGTPIPIADAGLNVSILYASGNNNTGMSGSTVDNTTQVTTNTRLLRLVAPVNRPDNVAGADAQKWLVRINRHAYVDQVAGV
jgi:hypothetical protein